MATHSSTFPSIGKSHGPICKREKSGIHSLGFFPLEVSLPALDGDVDRLSTEAFLPWLDLVCPLPTQASYSSLLVLPPR